MERLRIAIAGLGTVGRGTARILLEDAALLETRTGVSVELAGVCARDRAKPRGVELNGLIWYDAPLDMASDPGVDVVVELIGGAEGPARQLCEAALAAGKHVVTANKALIASHGVALARLAEENGVELRFEAAVAGGIPLIKVLREGLGANRISWLAGILNGTCNFILTEMERTRRDFAAVLEEAQQLGYAEADPTFDIDGIDTAHKLAILTSLAFGTPVDMQGVYAEGIRHIRLTDLDFAQNLGYRIKLLGISGILDGRVAQTVHPVMVRADQPLAAVNGPFNAVEISGGRAGRVVIEGAGAGELPTASAVVADIADIARGNRVPAFNQPVATLRPLPAADLDAIENAFYLRLNVIDRPGVVADVSAIMKAQQISIESLHQRSRKPGEPVNLVLTTHMSQEGAMRRALAALAALDCVLEQPVMIRIVDL